MKKSLVAAVVSAAVMIPLGAQAESELTVYGHVRNAITSISHEGDKESTTDVESLGSRFGFKANSDLGNGLTGLAQLEIGVNADKNNSDPNTRLGFVGLSGGFGTVTVGSQNSAFNSSIDEDNSIWEGGIGGGVGNRTSNTLKYANAVGPLSLQLDLRVNDKDPADDVQGANKGNGGGIGMKAALTDNITLGFAADTDDTNGADTDRIGVSGMVTLGQFWGSLSWINKEETNAMGRTTGDTDYTSLWVGADVADATSVHFGYGQEDGGGEATPTATTFGVLQNLGGGLKVWYEGQIQDDDDDSMPSKKYEAKHRVALEYVF